MSKSLGTRTWLFALTTGAIALIALHLWDPDRFGLDGPVVALVVFLYFLPSLSLIRRIRFFEFEADIDREQIERATEQAANVIEQQRPPGPVRLRRAYDELRELGGRDAVLALAKLRIEIESRLRRALSSHEIRNHSILSMISQLEDTGDLSRGTISSLRPLIEVMNRAVHGERIDPDQAGDVVEAGIEVLRFLDGELIESLPPTHSDPLTRDEVRELDEAVYELTTVIPTIPEGRRNKYTVNQRQLDQFLDGYNEYAEFLVALRPLPSDE